MTHVGKDLRHTHQNGHMRIVTTSMHHAHVLADIGSPYFAGERHRRPLNEWKRIHVRTQTDHRTRQIAFQYADHAGLPHSFFYFETQRTQIVRNDLRRAELAIAKLWMLMKIPSPGDGLRLELIGGGIDGGADIGLSACQRKTAKQEDKQRERAFHLRSFGYS